MTQSSKKVLILSDFQQVFWPLSSVLQLHWDCLMPQHLPFRLGVSFAAGSDVYCSKFPYVLIQQFRAVNELFHARGARSVKVVHTSLRHPTTVCWLPRLPITCRTIAACFTVTSWSAGKGKGSGGFGPPDLKNVSIATTGNIGKISNISESGEVGTNVCWLPRRRLVNDSSYATWSR